MPNYTFREKINRNGAVYNAERKDKFFVEDIIQMEECIVDLKTRLETVENVALKFVEGVQTKYYDTEIDKILFLRVECKHTGDVFKISLPIVGTGEGEIETGQMAIYSNGSNKPGSVLAASDSFTIPLAQNGLIHADIELSVEAGQIYWLAIQTTLQSEFTPFVYAPNVMSGVSYSAIATGINNWPNNPTVTARSRDLAIYMTGALDVA